MYTVEQGEDNEKSIKAVGYCGVGPVYDSTGATKYEMQENLQYGDEKVKSFTYALKVMLYLIPDKSPHK